MANSIDHPEHCGGEDDPYEAIKVIDAWELGFCLGNVVKYISRAGRNQVLTSLTIFKKPSGTLITKLKGC